MAKVNLIDTIMHRYDSVVKNNERSLNADAFNSKINLVRYYIAEDLDKKIGTEEIEETSIIPVLPTRLGQFLANYEYADGTIIFTIRRNKFGIDITGAIYPHGHVWSQDEIQEGGYENFMKVRVTEDFVSNLVGYPEDDLNVEEDMVTTFDETDAKSFSLRRVENGNLAYEGKLDAILYKKGDREYFNFSYTGQEEKVKHENFFHRVVDSIANSSLVSIPASRKIAPITESADYAYSKLRELLENNRITKKTVHPVKVKK